MKKRLLQTALSLIALCSLAFEANAQTAAPPQPNPYALIDRENPVQAMLFNMISPEAYQNPYFASVNTPNAAPLALCASPRRAETTDGEGDGDAEEEQQPEIYGVVIAASNYYNNNGLCLIPTSEGKDFTKVNKNQSSMIYTSVTSGTESNGMYYCNNLVSRYNSLYCCYYSVWDAKEWKREAYYQSSDFLYGGREMTTDPTTGKMYGCFLQTSQGVGYVLAEVTCESYSSSSVTYSRHVLCELPNMLTGMFFTADGQLWGIDLVTAVDEDGAEYTESSSLYKIDKNTGEMTYVGDTGVKPYYVTSAVCDVYNTGKVYWTVKTKDLIGSLYTVDTTTGEATKVCDFPHNEEVVSLFVMSEPSEKAPKMPENLRYNTQNGSLSGTIEFEVPKELADGTEGEGEVSYTVTFNNNVVGQGKAAYGETVSAPFSASYAMPYTATARLQNEYGLSERATLYDYIGAGTPEQPTLTYELLEDRVKLSWDKIENPVNGYGFLDPESITYRITKTSKDGTETLTEGTIATEYEDTDIDLSGNLAYYTYSVYAVSGEKVSAEAKTDMIILGSIIPPFTETFSNTALMDNLYQSFDLDGSTIGHWYIHAFNLAACASTGFGEENSWFITPAITLEAGKTYTISCDAYASYVKDNKHAVLGIAMGTERTPEGMTTEILPNTEVITLQANPTYEYGKVTIETSGTYYVGIHCNTLNGGAYLYVDNLTIEESKPIGRPAAPANFKAAVIYGSMSADISFMAPSLSIEGSDLEDPMTIVLKRDGVQINKWENVEPGTNLTHNDTALAVGEHTYSVSASNDSGEGLSASATAYLGCYAPKNVTAASITNLGNGKIKASWTPWMKDIKYNTLTADILKFCIVGPDEDGNTIIIQDDIDGDLTEFTFDAYDPDGTQKLVQYGVAQKTSGGYSAVTTTNVLPVGKAYATPFDESFSGNSDHLMYYGAFSSTAVQWALFDDSSFEGITSGDGDNAYVGVYSVYYNAQGGLFTGLIDISGLEHPGVSFLVYNLNAGNTNANEVMVCVANGSSTFYTLKAAADPIGSLGLPDGWCKYVVSLDNVAKVLGNEVQIGIAAQNKTHYYNFIDKIHIGELQARDISVVSIAASDVIDDGEDAYINVVLKNNGYEDVDFISDLYYNGEKVQSEDMYIEPWESESVTFAHKPDVDAADVVSYFVKSDLEEDVDVTDNTTPTVTSKVVHPAFPTVTSLSGICENNTSNRISWDQPDLTYTPNVVTESFEKAEPWTCEVEGWTMLDEDDLPITLGTANDAFPDIATGDHLSFFVNNVLDLDANRQSSIYFQAHTGNQYIGKAPTQDNTKYGDDWAITPELDGCEQTIRLWARSHSSSSPETMQLLYSNGSLDPADFVLLGKYYDIPQLWTAYDVVIPEGAKRFAIRAYSHGTYFLHIDDVQYIPAPANLEVVGYHVWRDGVRLTSTPITETEYVDPIEDTGEVVSYSYNVSVVYNLGESVPSEEVTCRTTSVDNLNAANIKIKARHDGVVVTNAAGFDVNVYLTDGRIAKSVAGTNLTYVNLPAGVYVVKVGNTVAKVVVK
jgi:hypothetical protein